MISESDAQRLWGQPNAAPYVKDAFHAYIISGRGQAVNPVKFGTKVAAHYVLNVPCGESKTVRLRLAAAKRDKAFDGFERVFKNRIADADEIYNRITPQSLVEDQRRVHRQALAGMLWSKQFYFFDLEQWLMEHKSQPLLESAQNGVRNAEWFHMLNSDVISMPDKWEYPWYAAWDLAFHTISLSYEYFHGDNGAGIGASHQTGWTGVIAALLDVFGRLDAKTLELEREQIAARLVREQVGGETRRAESRASRAG
jgi:hypothetical protein